MFSSRADWSISTNRLTLARQKWIADGREQLDLTGSNPTRVGLNYPEEALAELLSRSARASYDPDPRGLLSAREALAASLGREGAEVSPDDLILTASTSEAYSFLFKLLTDPGDRILTPAPAYPLLDHLSGFESVHLDYAEMEWRGRWSLEAGSLESGLRERTRAIAVVHPNNPTGTFLTSDALEEILDLCIRRSLPLISDEVFFDYPLAETGGCAPRAAQWAKGGLVVSLDGLSKSAGLPHWKLGWMHVAGSPRQKAEALAGLELIADTFLSVATPVQVALPGILALAPGIRQQILDRVIRNDRELRHAVQSIPSIVALPVEGGWSAVLRLPGVKSDEDLAVELLQRTGVLIHPGYFFDFPTDGFVVLSLLTRPEVFDEGVRRLITFVQEMVA